MYRDLESDTNDALIRFQERQVRENKALIRATIARDTANFLERGGTIETVPANFSGLDPITWREIFDGTNHLAPPATVFTPAPKRKRRGRALDIRGPGLAGSW